MKKKVLIGILSVVGLIAIITGTTLAFFSFSKNGSTENVIRAGNIAFRYDEISGKGRGINLIDALPVESNVEAKESNDYFDFRITADTSIAQIPYVLTARLSEDTNLQLDVVKVYLTKVVGTSEEEILYTTLDQLEEKLFNGNTDKILHRDTVPVNGQKYEVNYRLRLWIAEGTNYGTGQYNDKKLSLTVNVYTNDGDSLNDEHIVKADDTSIKMISGNNTYLLEESTDENVNYEVTVPYEVNTISFDTITRNMAATSNVTELGPTLSMANVTRLSTSSTYNLLVGDNYFKTTVTSADSSKTENYTLRVIREKYKDNNLTYLAVDGYSFIEDFDEDTTTYHVSNGVEASSITIIGNKHSDTASITGTGIKQLSWGENTFQVTVTPEDPTEQPKTYTIIINNVRPTAPSITGGSNDWVSNSPLITINESGTAISGIAGYEYYKTTIDDFPDDDTEATGTLTESPYSLEINENGVYYIYYRTISENGYKSVWSGVQLVKLDKGPTLATLTSAPSTKNQITANYTATTSLSEVKNVKCYYGTTNNPTTEVNPTGNNCVFSSLSANTTYYFKKCSTSNSNATTCSDVSSKITAGQVYNYAYTGGIQSLKLPYSGTYQLEVWGAQGGGVNGSTGSGGKGGYAIGNKAASANTTLYIVVGGQGTSGMAYNAAYNGGYNGGGKSHPNGDTYWGSGGGATHIATANGVLSALNSNRSAVLIVAGGGGGAGGYQGAVRTGGTGGGTTGGNGTSGYSTAATGGTQSAAGSGGYTGGETSISTTPSFGQGGAYVYSSGGGGGYFGGGPGYFYGSSAAGGSGYIGGVTGGSMSNGQRTGNGYARITVTNIN